MKLSLIKELQEWLDKTHDLKVALVIEDNSNFVYIRFLDMERNDRFSIGFEIDLTENESLQ